jgi:hypothetical protein
VATRVHEKYQSFFPRDVRFVADHAKRAITEFPLSKGKYYGVDYGERAIDGVPENEKLDCFVPDGSYPANDLSWYANIPVPTSYMIARSRGDFFGGYDHKGEAGTVHVANHHIAPGMKHWTWGNHDFGYAWDRSLTDPDGPYVELMAGVYTDNQPDRVCSHGVSAAVSSLWTASILLTYTFAAMNAALGTSGIFFTYSAICFAGCLLVARFVPETKGKTLEEIEAVVAASGGPRI